MIGRFLGIADTASNHMSYHILPESGVPMTAGTVQRMTYLEKKMEVNKQRMRDYDQKIGVKFKENRISTDGMRPTLEQWDDLVQEDEDFAEEFNRLYDNLEIQEADENFHPDKYDFYHQSEVLIPSGQDPHPKPARVTKKLKDHRENLIVTSSDRPELNTSMYEVEFKYGKKTALSANSIAESTRIPFEGVQA